MMWMHSWLAVAALAIAGGQALTPSTATPPSSAMPGQAHSGPAAGHWRLPDAAGPGQMVGRFFSHNGVALMEVRAHVIAPPAGATVGQLHGVVKRLVGPHPGPIGELRGHWRLDTPATGAFTAHIVRPGTPPELIGGMHGHFHDPHGPLPPGGMFHGQWRLDP